MMPRAFELQVLHAEQWTIDTIFRDRETALRTARELHAASPQTPVRVIDESFDPETGEGASAVIYRAPREINEMPSERPAPRPPSRVASSPPPPPVRPKKPSVVTAVVTLTLIIGGAGLALIAVLAWVSGFVRG